MICLSHEGSEQPNESGTVVKEFGGLPWNLLFKEKPEFASGDTVLNCRLIERKGRYFSDYVLRIDDVEIRNSCLPEYEQEFSYKEGKLYIRERTITDYLQEKDTTLLLYWFMELNKELNKGGAYYSEYEAYIPNPPRDSITTLMDFLNRDFTTSNKEQHRTIVENYKALLLEKIPREEVEKAIDSTSPLGDKAPFFRFCVEQGMLFPIEEDSFHFTLNTKLSIEKFIYLINEAEEYHFQTAPKGTELYPYIWKDSKGTQYSKGSFTKSKGGVRITTNDYKPPFHEEIQRKKRNA